MAEYDFSGWATRTNLKCSDGRTILPDAFKDNDGEIVPLVWNHQHGDSSNILGHALLENRSDGVYAYGTFNDTPAGQNAKLLVQHGDISALSIYANKLKHNGSAVLHGAIREVSLVLAGANPGAYIESIIAHGEESDDEAVIYTGEPLLHSMDLTTESKEENKEIEVLTHTQTSKEEPMAEKTVEDVVNEMTEEQRNVLYYLVGQAAEEQGGEEMKHNIFDNEDGEEMGATLTHADMEAIIADAKRYGSVKDSFLAHAEDYGIDQIDYLFPEAQNLNNPPEFIKRDTGWVSGVMSGVHHTPFSRIKSMFADITEDDARAKGYIKGKLKKEEVFSLLKRTTSPTTVYKKQKMDRDDVIDITSFDVIAWLKGEMRLMLDEELARAILIGDGRLTSSDDKIDESNIRPIWKDDALYTVKAKVSVAANDTDEQKAKKFINTVIKSRKEYKGSGNPTLYTTEDVVTDCLLMEDGIGHKLYKSVDELATAMRVSKIVTVEVMENQTRTGVQAVDGDTKVRTLMGLIVNLADYNVGADKGGAVNMFDDFDIDYNQMKYLIETRCSGALIKPFSAIAVESVVDGSAA